MHYDKNYLTDNIIHKIVATITDSLTLGWK